MSRASRLIAEIESSDHDKGLLKALGIQDPGNWDLEQDYFVFTRPNEYCSGLEMKTTKVRGYKAALMMLAQYQKEHQEEGAITTITKEIKTLIGTGPGSYVEKGQACLRWERFENGKWTRRRSSEAIYRQRPRGKQ